MRKVRKWARILKILCKKSCEVKMSSKRILIPVKYNIALLFAEHVKQQISFLEIIIAAENLQLDINHVHTCILCV